MKLIAATDLKHKGAASKNYTVISNNWAVIYESFCYLAWGSQQHMRVTYV